MINSLWSHGDISVRDGWMSSLGISAGSDVWGAFIDPFRGVSYLKSNESDPTDAVKSEGPHMVLSPIHPDLWPFTFRIVANLKRNRPPGIEKLFQILGQLRLNIEYVSSQPVGHSRWQITVFAHEERVLHQPSPPPEPTVDARCEAYKDMGLVSIPRAHAIRAELEKGLAEYLDDRVGTFGLMPFFLDSNTDVKARDALGFSKANRDSIRDIYHGLLGHCDAAVTCNLLMQLSYAWTWMNVACHRTPYRFCYDEGDRVLRPAASCARRISDDWAKLRGVPSGLPSVSHAVGVLMTTERVLKLRFLRPETVRVHYRRIVVRYATNTPFISAVSSRGLFERIVALITSAEGRARVEDFRNSVSISEEQRESDNAPPKVETGRVELLVAAEDAGKNPDEWFDQLAQGIEKDLRSTPRLAGGASLNPVRVKVSALPISP